MQQLKTAAAIFCTACICAELVGQLLGDVRGRQCIKAAAGLYILVTLFHALPGIRDGAAGLALPAVAGLALPAVEAEQFGTAESAILRQAERDLAEKLEEQIELAAGLAVELTVTLAESDEGVYAARVEVRLPAGAGPAQRTAAEQLLCEALGAGPEAIVWAEEEGG